MKINQLIFHTKISLLAIFFTGLFTVNTQGQACDADPGTIITTNATNFVCNLGDPVGVTTFNTVTNNDFNATPADPCGLAGTPGVGYYVYSGTPNGGDPETDPNFTGAVIGSGPQLDPGTLMQNIEYSFGGGTVGPISWGVSAGNAATNYNITYQICPVYYFDEASSLTSVDYDCGGPTALCGPVAGTTCVPFTVLSPITFSNNGIACGAAPYLGTLTVDVSGSYPSFSTGSGLDPLGDNTFTVINTGGNGSLMTPSVNDNGTITLTDIANGPFQITVSTASGCEQSFAGVWNQPTMTLNATATETCAFGPDCTSTSTIALTGNITPQLGRFAVCGMSDSFSSETSWQVTNSAGAVVWNSGAGPGGTTTWNALSPNLDPNDTYFITFLDSFGDGWSCGTADPTVTVRDDGGAGCGGTTVYAYNGTDWDSGSCGNTTDADYPNGNGSSFGPFPLGSPTAFVDPIGTLSGTGVTDNGDNTGTFDVGTSGAGAFTVTYDYTDGQGCVLQEQVTINVNTNPAAPVAEATNPTTFCPNDPTALSVVDNIVAAPDADPTTADVASYEWYGDDGTGNPDIAGGTLSTTATYDPGENAGTWHVRAVSHQGCFGCFTAISLAQEPLCCDIVLVTANGTGEGCPNANDGSITITATSSNAIEYSIDNGTTFFAGMTTFTGLADGTYNVVVQDVGDPTCAASTTVTVTPGTDIVNPTITCPANSSFECFTGLNTAAVGPNTPQDPIIDPIVTGMPVTSDNCGVASVSYQDVIVGPTPANCPNIFEIQRTWTVVDENGLTNSCVQTFTVTDTTPPTINEALPADVTVECDAVPAPTTLTGSDNCDASVAITLVEVSTQTGNGTCSDNSYTITRTWTATDECNNATTHTQTVTVEDTTPPTITCPADPAIAIFTAGFNTNPVGPNTPQDPSIDPGTTGTATATDNCSTVVITYQDVISGPSADCSAIYVVERTWTATDACGLTTTCLQTFTFEGDPVIVNVATTPEICTGTPTGSITITATSSNPPLEYSIDGGATFSASNQFQFIPAGTYTIVVRDANATACAVTQTAVVGPGFPCILEIFDPCVCLDNATPIDLDAGTGGDDGQFGEEVTVRGPNGTPLPPGLILTVVTGTTGAFDAYNVPPTGTQSAGVPIPVDGSVTLTYDPADGFYKIPFVHVESIGYTISVEGPFAFGNPNNITLTTQNVCAYPNPVFDPALDALYCPNAASFNLGGSAIGGADNVSFTINGNPTSVFDPAALGVGTHLVQMSYDGAADGNAGISPDGTTPALPGCIQDVIQTIEVNDLTPPVALCQNITIELDDNGNASILVTDINNGSFDNCGIESIVIDKQDFNCNDVGNNNVTLTVTDVLNNVSNCIGIVTVEDNIPPQILCRAPVNTCGDDDICGANLTLIAPLFLSDNCATSAANLTVTNDGPNIFPIGQTLVTWSVTDESNNTSTCTQSVTVNDCTAPVIECGDSFTAFTSWTNCGYPSTILNQTTAEDNCGVVSLTSDAPAFFPPGNYMVKWMAVDAAGNSTTCMQWVKVYDTTMPKLTSCPEDIIVQATSADGTVVTWNEPTAMDNCPGDIIWVSTHDSGDEFQIGVTEVVYIGYDQYGNSTECAFSVTVENLGQPLMSVSCPDAFSISLPNEQTWSSIGWNPPLMNTECEDCEVLEDDHIEYIGTLAGHQYYVYTGQNISWLQANNFAQNLNAALVILEDLKEIPMIQNELPEGNYYIGLIDEDGDNNFTWADNSVYNETLTGDLENDSETPMGVMMNEEGEWQLTSLTDSVAQFVFEKTCINVETLITQSANDFNVEMAETNSSATISYYLEDICGNEISCEFPIEFTQENVDYCLPSGIATDEENPFFIQSFGINEEVNNSGDNEGYANYTNFNFVVEQGSELSIASTFGPVENNLPLYCRLWIDLNNDGDFYDEGELALEGVEYAESFATLIAPEFSEELVETRLRIAVSRLTFPEPCGNFLNGEVEDYTISFVKSDGNLNPGSSLNATNGDTEMEFRVYPNPVNNELIVHTKAGERTGIVVALYDNLGRVVVQQKEMETNQVLISTAHLENGVYWIQLTLSNGQELKEKIVKMN